MRELTHVNRTKQLLPPPQEESISRKQQCWYLENTCDKLLPVAPPSATTARTAYKTLGHLIPLLCQECFLPV